MITLETLSDLDLFFYYSQNDAQAENESDLIHGLTQPPRTMFYNRRDGAGASNYENFPNAYTLEIAMRYAIANWSAYRNTQVTDGNNGTRDRRIAISQDSIDFTRDNKGNLNISVGYIPFADIKQAGAVMVPTFGGA